MPSRKVHVRVLPGCHGRISCVELRRVARSVLTAEDVASEVEVEVVLADEATVRDLNRLYRGREEATDVLSFATHEGEAFVESPDAAPSLGEVIICVPVAEASLSKANRSVEGAISHLLVHGLLHLLGYDHEDSDEESLRMQAREDQLLSALGYAGRYAHGH